MLTQFYVTIWCQYTGHNELTYCRPIDKFVRVISDCTATFGIVACVCEKPWQICRCFLEYQWFRVPLQWRHNEHDSDSNHQRFDGLLHRLFRQIKETSKLRVTGLCEGNSSVNSPHKRPVPRKMFPFDDVIMVFQVLTPFFKMADEISRFLETYHVLLRRRDLSLVEAVARAIISAAVFQYSLLANCRIGTVCWRGLQDRRWNDRTGDVGWKK